MKKSLTGLVLLSAFHAHSAIYIEGDILYPTLTAFNVVGEDVIDLRLGYIAYDWNFSLRYTQVRKISYSGSTGGTDFENISISDAEDTYASVRAGYIKGPMTFGAGIGSYNRDFETSLAPNENKTYGKNMLGVEAFMSYKHMIGHFYISPEINYIAADVRTEAKRSNSNNFYNISFKPTNVNLLLLAGYQF